MGEFNESGVEQAALDWLQQLGYQGVFGPHIAPKEPGAERSSFIESILSRRLKEALARLNPDIPQEALDEAFRQILLAPHSSLIANNRAFHRMLVDGITVECRVLVSYGEKASSPRPSPPEE